jgi:hypothetical protein
MEVLVPGQDGSTSSTILDGLHDDHIAGCHSCRAAEVIVSIVIAGA